LSDLPGLVFPTAIDGTSQPGYSGTPLIELDGTNAFSATIGFGIEINNGCTVKGLVINRFALGSSGILVLGNNNTIIANYIGTNAAGTAALPNTGFGINVAGSNNVIGGTTAADRNLISGNRFDGVLIETNGNIVQGNYIGTDISGTVAIPNGDSGVFLNGA